MENNAPCNNETLLFCKQHCKDVETCSFLSNYKQCPICKFSWDHDDEQELCAGCATDIDHKAK